MNRKFSYIKKIVELIQPHIVMDEGGFYHINMMTFGDEGGILSEYSLLIIYSYIKKKNDKVRKRMTWEWWLQQAENILQSTKNK
jgi:hypothetical protein